MKANRNEGTDRIVVGKKGKHRLADTQQPVAARRPALVEEWKEEGVER